MIVNKKESNTFNQNILNQIGNTDISEIGDGTLTSAVSTNANSISELNNALNEVTNYVFTPDTLMVENASMTIKKKNGFLTFRYDLGFATKTTIDAWKTLQIGTIANWDLGSMDIGRAFNVSNNPTALCIMIDDNGNVFIKIFGESVTVSNAWFHGSQVIIL